MSSSSGEKSSVPVLGIESPAVGFRKMAVAPRWCDGNSRLFLSGFCGFASAWGGRRYGAAVVKLCIPSAGAVGIHSFTGLFLSSATAARWDCVGCRWLTEVFWRWWAVPARST